MQPTAPAPAPDPVLRTFGGIAPGLAADLLTLKALPTSVRPALWKLVGPNLSETLDAAAQEQTQAFADAHGVPIDAVIPVVRGCRSLFRRAAQMDLSVEVVHQDLLKLTQDRELSRRFAACYTHALPAIRSEAVLASLSRFGPELVDFGLRMDHVASSRNAPNNMVAVAMLSLRYRDGGENRNLTVQVPPAVLKRMQLTLNAIFK